MKWISTGIQIGQAVKNVQRLRHILAVLTRHGFQDTLHRMRLNKFLPTRRPKILEGEPEQAGKTVPERLRLAFEELGPTFVKLGQVLSTRPDLLPQSWIDEFVKLQDNVAPLPFETIKNVIEGDFKRPLGELYDYFDPTPLASASIAQVHEARLKTGDKVVVKVQRPDIKKLVETDISLLEFLAKLLERYVPESRLVSPTVVVNEFFKTLSLELDFSVEMNNILKISSNVASYTDVVIPKVERSLCSIHVLTMQKIEGIKMSEVIKNPASAKGLDGKKIVELGAKVFLKAVLMDGLFHADLHGGNLFVLPNNKLGIIDFGQVGRLSERSRDQLANILMSLITEDYENLCYQYIELSDSNTAIDFEAFQRDIRHAVSPFLGLSLHDVNSGKILIEATKIATKYEIHVPGDWMLIFKSMLTIEGMGRALDPRFDLLPLGQEMVKEIVRNQFNVQRLTRDALWIGKDIMALLRVMPKHLRWMFKKFNSDDFAFEIKLPQFERFRRQIDVNSKRQSLAILCGFLFLAGSGALTFITERNFLGLPLLSATLFGLAALLFVRILTLR